MRGVRILVAEDTPANQTLVRHLLEKRGHEVVLAANGREALAAMEKQPFDLILMDVQMPVMDGFKATAAIRKKEKITGAHIPIVAMTAHAMHGDRDRCLQAGMDSYISKPIRGRTMFESIEQLLSAADGPAASQESEKPALVDVAALLAGVGGDLRLLGELANLFLGDYRRMLSRIKKAIAARKPKELADAAHALKGSVATFSLGGAFKAARTLEAIAKKGRLAGAQKTYQSLEAELSSLVKAIVPLRTKPRARR